MTTHQSENDLFLQGHIYRLTRVEIGQNLMNFHFVLLLLSLVFLRYMSSQAGSGADLGLTEGATIADPTYVVALDMVLQVSLLPKGLLTLTAEPRLGWVKLSVVSDELGHQVLKF